jgi:hypothetical protein
MTRYFLIPKVHKADAFDAFRSAWMDALVAWGQRFTRKFVFAGRDTPSDHSEEWIFRDDPTGATLHLVRDWRMPPLDTALCYASLTGPSEVVDPLVADAWRWPWQHDRASMAALAARELATDPSMILLLALAGASMPPDAATDSVMTTALRHTDATVRYLAIFAVQQVGWVDYLPVVQSLAESDRDPNVRILATETLTTLRA